MPPTCRAVPLVGRGKHSFEDQGGHRAEPLSEQLLPELVQPGARARHQTFCHQSGGLGGQRSADVRSYRKVRLRCRAFARTVGRTE